MAELVFNRKEKKYMMTSLQHRKLLEAVSPYMEADSYGKQTICNIYYDTKNYDLIRRSIDKPVYKEKIRLRSYGIPTAYSTVYLEIKKKYQGIVNKRRVEMKLLEAYKYMDEGIAPGNKNQIFEELDFCNRRYDLVQKTYLAYDRIAYAGKTPDGFRLTIDNNIRGRIENTGLEIGDYGEAIIPKDNYLMEIKIMGAVPLWFTHILSDLRIYPSSFSKYGTYYKNFFSRISEPTYGYGEDFGIALEHKLA